MFIFSRDVFCGFLQMLTIKMMPLLRPHTSVLVSTLMGGHRGKKTAISNCYEQKVTFIFMQRNVMKKEFIHLKHMKQNSQINKKLLFDLT